jgi:myosin heavy subunit
MDYNNNNPMTQPGQESLNERLRRAAEIARKNIAADGQSQQPASPQPAQQQPVQESKPTATPPPYEKPRYEQPSYASQKAETPMMDEPAQPKQKKSKKMLIIVIALAVLLALAIVAMLMQSAKTSSEMEAQQQQIEQLQLQNEQIQLANEYENLNNEYAQYENQTALLANDSIVQKYAAARAQVEKLLNELNNQKNKSAAQIKQLKGEIETLKTILRSYVEQINELKQENQSLRTENEEVKAQNSQLSQTVQNVQATNQHLNERMTLAEKLNVTGVNLIALNKKGKQEKNVTKARQLEVTFTIPQNNSTPVGEKTIYVRITSPEGELLGNGGSFKFEGSTLQCTARKNIEYQGEEIGGIKIYWDVSATLNPGDYTVELFADNYRLASRRFTLKK